MAISKDIETQTAIQQQHRAVEKRKVGKRVADGERDMQIHPKLFANGLRYGRKHGVDNAWNDPNAVDEFKKVHPEIVVGSGRSSSLSAPIRRHPKMAVMVQKEFEREEREAEKRRASGYKQAWLRNAEKLAGAAQ